MGFLSCVGRVLFASLFLFTAWQEFNTFGTDGGPKAKYLRPKYKALKDVLPEFEIKALVAAGIALKGMGGILFVLGCPIGAYLLLLHLFITTPVLHDFYRHPCGSGGFFRSLMQFAQELALFGALLFFLGMKKSIQRRNPMKRPPKSKASFLWS